MNKKNYLITGVAGFIGFNIAIGLLKKNNIIYGVDNFEKYYSVKYKNFRLNKLKEFKNFKFKRIDIKDKTKLLNSFKNKKIDLIINCAAQAGVRYSFVNPKTYIGSNFFGFLNLIFLAKQNKIKKIIYSSSSSVYGDAKRLPVNERNELSKKNIYATTKKLNEDTAELYSKINDISFIGLRFFTIFGEWGRPDMLMFKMFKSQIEKKPIYINNNGNHYRDFTYIGDVVKIINRLVNKKINGHEIFNVSSNHPIKLLELVKNFNKKYPLTIKYAPLDKADVINTHGDNYKIKKITNIKNFSNFYEKLFKTFLWYKKNKINKIT
jgi:UDP-glucuronate 4-epimerase